MPQTRGIPRQSDPHGGFNEHRNSSRVFPVPPDALPAALAALRTVDMALRRWIEDGHPRLTEAEHVARFGEPYARSTPKRAAKSGHTGGTSPLS